MQVKITEMVPQVRTIDVELPYYYIHDFNSELGQEVRYGKIEEKVCYEIHEKRMNRGDIYYQIEREAHSSIKESGLYCYFEKPHASTREEFEAARQRCQAFFNEF